MTPQQKLNFASHWEKELKRLDKKYPNRAYGVFLKAYTDMRKYYEGKV